MAILLYYFIIDKFFDIFSLKDIIKKQMETAKELIKTGKREWSG